MKKLVAASVILLNLIACATQYSCLSIITETKKIGKWQQLKGWIESAGLKDEWDKCQYVSDDYAQYATVTNALVAYGVLSESEIKSVLEASKDTAVPDSALRRVYNSDIKTSSGRNRWHGKMVRQIIDTNLWVRTTVYEDGTSFTDKAARPQVKSVARVKESYVAMTNGIPARLAAARLRWADNMNNGNVSNVTVTVRAGK